MTETANDRIFFMTRVVAAILVPFLVTAFLILYFFPEESGERFAYRIEPPVMAAYVGAGYLGGAYLFLQVLFGRRWHQVAAGFPPVTAFAASMLLVTHLHWNRYSVDDLPFQLWLGLYVITPVLVPAIWLYNRRADPRRLSPGDIEVAYPFRLAVRLLGVAMAAIVLTGFVAPASLMGIWPWNLTELTARLLAGWGALLAVANIYISFERRWSAWRIGVESIALWHVVFLISAVANPEDFKGGTLANWYILIVAVILVGMAGAYTLMERTRKTAGCRAQKPT